MTELQAVIFDFDGTICDSEWPIYEASAAALREMGLALSVAGWATVVGLGHDDSFAALERAVGATIDREEFESRYESMDRSWVYELEALPGALELIRALAQEGIAVGVASSSSRRWVEGHLGRLGVLHLISVVATRDSVEGRTKPDPASYRFVLEALGVGPQCAVAIEDSAPGISAALGADLKVIAIPSRITRFTDLSAASAEVQSLAELDVANLRAFLARFPSDSGRILWEY